MTPLSIITDFLRGIPAPVRKGMLLVLALAVVATQVAEAFDVDLHTGIYKTLAIIGGYLGVQSAVNVTPVPPVDAPEVDADSGLAAEEVDGWHPEAD